MISLQIFCFVSAWLAVCLRFWIKCFLVKRVAWDDLWLLLAMLFFSGEIGCLIRADIFHDGHPAVKPETWRLLMVASQGLSIMANAMLKTSLALTLMRLLASRWQRMLIITVTITFNLYATAQIFANIFACGMPSQLIQKHSIQDCVNWHDLRVLSYFSAVFNATTDWTYILLPPLAIWQSNISRPIKISASFITIIGVASGVAAVVRAVYAGGFNGFHRQGNQDMKTAYAGLFELAFGFIATSLASSTQILTYIKEWRTINTAIPDEGKPPGYDDATNVIKLSPIICQQKSSVNTPEGSNTMHTLALPVPAVGRANRFSWGRAPAPPVGHGNIVLLIDDVSDDEDEGLAAIGEVSEKSYTNV